MDGRDLKIYSERAMEVQSLRDENRFLRGDRDWLRAQMFHANERFAELEERHARVVEENRLLQRRVEELTRTVAASDLPPPPAFVKANLPKRRRKRPGRKAGHAAALRPVPGHVDVRQDVPLPIDATGNCCCRHCNCSLGDVREHERLVEDLVPQQVVVTAYHTRSGWCAMCRKRVESRASEQPPAADLPHGQLGLNALATAATLRVVHRLPLRQVSRVLADLPGLRVSAGGIARQLQRLARWLDPYYERLLLALRASPRVHADETGWRTDGKNGFVWTITDARRTLYHVDPSRSGTVIEALLGKAFGGTLVSDFYGAYARLDCKKQKCLVHLLREFVQTAEKHPAFAAGAFYIKGKRLIGDLLRLKGRWDQLDDDRYTSGACRLETKLDQLLAIDYEEANEKRIAKRMRRHRKELTAFLWDRHLDGTNNAAERVLRPAVVARKISGGSRSGNGADAWAKLASLMRTADQQGRNVLAVVKQLLIEHWSGKPAMALLAGP
jgi:transposase